MRFRLPRPVMEVLKKKEAPAWESAASTTGHQSVDTVTGSVK